MDFLAENDLDREKYGNNLFILAYASAKNKSSKFIREKFKMDDGTNLEMIRNQFHDLLGLPFVTDGMLDDIRERLNEEAGRARGDKQSTAANTTEAKFHLVPFDYFAAAFIFIVTFTLGGSVVKALLWSGFAVILYGMTNKYLAPARNSKLTVVETATAGRTNTTFGELCSYGAELIEAHLRYTDSPARPLS